MARRAPQSLSSAKLAGVKVRLVVEPVLALERHLSFKQPRLVTPLPQARGVFDFSMRLGAVRAGDCLDQMGGGGDFGPYHIAPTGRKMAVVTRNVLVGRGFPTVHIQIHYMARIAELRLGAEVQEPSDEAQDMQENHQNYDPKPPGENHPLAPLTGEKNAEN